MFLSRTRENIGVTLDQMFAMNQIPLCRTFAHAACVAPCPSERPWRGSDKRSWVAMRDANVFVELRTPGLPLRGGHHIESAQHP